MRRIHLLMVAAGVIAGSAAAAVAGWAYFTAIGSGPGAASVGGLAPPTGVTASVPDPTVRTVHASWTPATSPDGSGLAGYTVARSDGSATSAACGTGTTPLAGTATSCDDTNVPSGSYTYTATVQWRSWTASSAASGSVTMAAGALHHFNVVPSTSTPVVATQLTVTVTAIDQYGTTLAGYTGSQCVRFSGPSNSPSPSNTAPTYPAGGAGCTGGNSLVTFSSGVGTPNATLFDAQATTLTATDVPSSTTGSAALTVSPLGLDHFVVNPSTTTPTAGSSFTATLSAHDLYDNAATSYTGTKTITWSGLATSPAPASQAPSYPASSVSFSSGASTTALAATAYSAPAPHPPTAPHTSRSGSAAYAVSPLRLDHFVVNPSTSTPTAGSSFTEH